MAAVAAAAAKFLRNGASNVLVMAGAGISTPSGLPDFRSSGSGLYDTLDDADLPYPEAVFDIDFFTKNPSPFYRLARRLFPGQYSPNKAHSFIRLLQDKRRLLRLYTQNIDGLERLAGVRDDRLVEAHGTFALATCRNCSRKFSAEDIRDDVFAARIPRCIDCSGVIKPDVVFFGEMLPDRFERLRHADAQLCDLLIVMGTSLEVYPFASLADMVGESVPRLLINQTSVRSMATHPRPNDLLLLADVIGGVTELAKACGWSQELETLSDSAYREE